ncbi:hypothetical protein GCM10027034_28650 [Ramlibacter solisilvae]|uniref:Uncharacterized protein n=1 Tax=Ramlibacter tataouinensis TaxID=94132 RepID=A0A127JRF9_9BURK|nr:hypothetical protein [Ramlibacter tataouinensis]AMO22483.1 hypothetical protein UC35_05735 [Ramlibacter tataouinensis]
MPRALAEKKHWKAWAGQAAGYGLFAAVLGVFSHWPRYEALAPDVAVVKVSFIHHGARAQPCRAYTAEELAKMPPNMRAPMKCGRERLPVAIEVAIDGRPVLSRVAPPSGLSRDGASSVYHRLELPAGEHRISVRLRDAPGEAFNHVREATVRLSPAQVLVIDFDAATGGIKLT